MMILPGQKSSTNSRRPKCWLPQALLRGPMILQNESPKDANVVFLGI